MSSESVFETLRALTGKRVKLTFSDGEVVVAELELVLEEEAAVTFDLVESNRPDKYERSDKRPHIFADVNDILRCELAPHAR